MSISKEAARVQKVLDSFDLDLKVIELKQSTHSAKDAADALDCNVGQIAKSLVFQGKESRVGYLVIASGKNRVDKEHLSEFIGESASLASPDFVTHITGFEVGGIPPVGHISTIPTFIDQDLMDYETIWAAAGTSRAVFELTPLDLKKITDGHVISIH